MLDFKINIDDSQVQRFFRQSPVDAKRANAEALKMTGGHVRKQVRSFIEGGGSGWKPLSPLTKKQKLGAGHLTPLYFMGRLVRFKYGTVKGFQRVVIGFFPTRQIKTGYSVTSVKKQRQRFRRSFSMTHEAFAKMHAMGKTFRVKKSTRGAFAGRGRPLKKTTTSLTIPKRDMIGPVFKREQNNIRIYYKKRFLQKFFTMQSMVRRRKRL